MAYLGASPTRVVIVNLEDLWLETRPQNVPGTWEEPPTGGGKRATLLRSSAKCPRCSMHCGRWTMCGSEVWVHAERVLEAETEAARPGHPKIVEMAKPDPLLPTLPFLANSDPPLTSVREKVSLADRAKG